jgi:hypothetical protein
MFTWPGNVPAHLSGSFVLALLPILGLGFCHDCCELGFCDIPSAAASSSETECFRSCRWLTSHHWHCYFF